MPYHTAYSETIVESTSAPTLIVNATETEPTTYLIEDDEVVAPSQYYTILPTLPTNHLHTMPPNENDIYEHKIKNQIHTPSLQHRCLTRDK